MSKSKKRMRVYNKFAGHCAYCGKKIRYEDMQIDHVVPKAHGGTDDISNLYPSCRRCNHYKRTSSIEGFRNMISQIPKKLMRDNYIYKVGVDFGFFGSEPEPVVFYFEKWKK